LKPFSILQRFARRQIFWIFVSSLLVVGFLLGYRLSAIPHLNVSKLLNIIGLLYSFIGVLVLSEIIGSSPQWRRISVEILAPLILYLHSTIPLGAFVGASAGLLTHHPSSAAVSQYSFGFFAYSLIPLLIVDEFVVYPRIWPHTDTLLRFRLFGLYLVLSGVGLQLFAAAIDLLSY
jgi:hypothetical protein